MTGSHRERYRQIARILSRHGLGYLVGVAGLDRWVPFQHGLLGHERRPEPYTRPDHVRLALEQLGPTFIKLGQILSTRPELLPPEYLAELAKLQDDTPPVPGDGVRDALIRELGGPPEAAFATFDPVPLATGSIGQAHAATLLDGTEVVVKVRRPGVVEQVERDLEILQNLAARAAGRWEAAADFDAVGLAEDFADTLRTELDYLREARNAERFATNFATDPHVHVPRVFWETTTSRVLTMERIRGINIGDTAALDRAGVDRAALARQATHLAAKMIFEDGFFHADPHPGNLFVEPAGRIALIDFGMVGEVDERLREQLAILLLALTSNDAGQLTAAFIDLSTARRTVDPVALRSDLEHALARLGQRPIGETPFGPLIADVLGIARRHHLQLPKGLALLLKMVVMAEGLGARLDPQFRLGEVLGPYAQRLVVSHLSLEVLARRLAGAGAGWARQAVELPQQLGRLVSLLEHGDLGARMRPDELDLLIGRVERAGDRIALALLAGAALRVAADLTARDPALRRRWQGRLATGSAAVCALGAAAAWGRRLLPGRVAALSGKDRGSGVYVPRA